MDEQLKEEGKELKGADRELKGADRELKKTDRELKKTDRELKKTDRELKKTGRELKAVNEQDSRKWTVRLLEQSVQILLFKQNTNFESLIKHLEENKDLYQLVYEMLVDQEIKTFNMDTPTAYWGVIHGLFQRQNGSLKIHNRVYEQRIYNYMVSKLETKTQSGDYNFRDQFLERDRTTEDGIQLNLKQVLLKKFQMFMAEKFSTRDKNFYEKHGRLLFLAFHCNQSLTLEERTISRNIGYFCSMVENFRREGHFWIFSGTEQLEQTINLESISCQLPLSDVYEDIEFKA